MLNKLLGLLLLGMHLSLLLMLMVVEKLTRLSRGRLGNCLKLLSHFLEKSNNAAVKHNILLSFVSFMIPSENSK